MVATKMQALEEKGSEESLASTHSSVPQPDTRMGCHSSPDNADTLPMSDEQAVAVAASLLAKAEAVENTTQLPQGAALKRSMVIMSGPSTPVSTCSAASHHTALDPLETQFQEALADDPKGQIPRTQAAKDWFSCCFPCFIFQQGGGGMNNADHARADSVCVQERSNLLPFKPEMPSAEAQGLPQMEPPPDVHSAQLKALDPRVHSCACVAVTCDNPSVFAFDAS